MTFFSEKRLPNKIEEIQLFGNNSNSNKGNLLFNFFTHIE